MKPAVGISVGRGKTASGIKVHSRANGFEACGEEDGDRTEGFSSEPDVEDRYSPQAATLSLQLHSIADSIPSSPASSQL